MNTLTIILIILQVLIDIIFISNLAMVQKVIHIQNKINKDFLKMHENIMPMVAEMIRKGKKSAN